jgi:hypothetical protein
VNEFTKGEPLEIAVRMAKMATFGIFTPLLTLLLFFIRIIWSITIITMTTLSQFLYITFSSLFAITYYSDHSFLETLSKINIFINNREEIEDESVLKKTIDFILKQVYTHMFEIVFLITFVMSSYEYSSKIKTDPLKIIMTSICYIFIFLVCFIIYQRSIGISTKNIMSPVNPVIPVTPVT